MRNNPEPESGTWASLVLETRKAAGLSQQKFGALIGVDRSTVWRWENWNQKPDSVEVVATFAEATGAHVAVAMQRSGYAAAPRPTADASSVPEPAIHAYARKLGLELHSPIVAKILAGPWDEGMMRFMLDRERQWQDAAIQQRIEQIEVTEEAYRRRGGEDAGGVHKAA